MNGGQMSESLWKINKEGCRKAPNKIKIAG